LLPWCISSAFAAATALGGSAWAAVSITPPSGQSRTHNTANAPQVFPEQVWSLTSNELLGATVQLTAGPFVHATEPSVKVNCKLDLRVVSSQTLALWATVAATDQTNIAAGKQTARVSARSTATGNGTVGLTVTYQNSSFSTTGAGNYSTTVTGTIVPNL
jgi:hypothetical protein